MTEPYTPTPEEARDWFILGVHQGRRGGAIWPDKAEAFDRMLEAVRAAALRNAAEWMFDSIEGMYTTAQVRAFCEHFGLTAEGSEPSGKNGGERAGRTGRERFGLAPVTPPAEDWEDPEPFFVAEDDSRHTEAEVNQSAHDGSEHGGILWNLAMYRPRTREQYDAEEADRGE